MDLILNLIKEAVVIIYRVFITAAAQDTYKRLKKRIALTPNKGDSDIMK